MPLLMSCILQEYKSILKNAFFFCWNRRKYTSFVTHPGQFEFLYMNYWLSDATLVSQRYIYNVFHNLINEKAPIVCTANFIIPAENKAEGVQKLQHVFTIASEYGIELYLKKCHFLQWEIDIWVTTLKMVHCIHLP